MYLTCTSVGGKNQLSFSLGAMRPLPFWALLSSNHLGCVWCPSIFLGMLNFPRHHIPSFHENAIPFMVCGYWWGSYKKNCIFSKSLALFPHHFLSCISTTRLPLLPSPSLTYPYPPSCFNCYNHHPYTDHVCSNYHLYCHRPTSTAFVTSTIASVIRGEHNLVEARKNWPNWCYSLPLVFPQSWFGLGRIIE